MEEQFRQYYKKDFSKSIFCERWTFFTRCCYKYKTKCELCPNSIVCEKYFTTSRNEYGIHPIKYATLMTLARLGKPKGELNMVKGFEKAEMEYERLRELACEPCEPKIIRAEKAYEPDGYSMEYTYNCEECDCEECEYWSDYNDTRDE